MVESPCVNICKLNSTGEYCLGCNRTLDEIRNWSKMTVEQKLAVLEKVFE